MMKKPFLRALLAILYIVVLVSLLGSVESFVPDDTILIPMIMLSFLVLSVLVMGFLFLAEPIRLYMENQKKEAVTFFCKTVGSFAGLLVVLLAIFFLLVS